MLSLLWMLLIGLAAGWIASKVMKAERPGVIGMMIVGVLGSFIGGALFWLIGLKAIGVVGQLVTSTVGAIVCIGLIRKFGPRF